MGVDYAGAAKSLDQTASDFSQVTSRLLAEQGVGSDPTRATAPTAARPPASASYRPDIDGLRGLAVTSVVIFHAFEKVLPGGFLGVDVFFVISGYLVSRSLYAQVGRGEFSFADFYARRVRRIFPALILVLLATFGLGWICLDAAAFRQLAKHQVGGTAFVSNLVLWRETGYFDASAISKPLLHLWSLGIEEQFYIVWPVLLVVAARVRVKLINATVLVGATSFAINIVVTSRNPGAAFYLPITRLWELLAGSIVAWISLARPELLSDSRAGVRTLASALGMTVVVVGVAATTQTDRFPGWLALLPVVGTMIVIGAGRTSRVNRLLSDRRLVWVGLISYPLYLWHWPLLTMVRLASGREPSTTLTLATVAVSVLLAWMTYRVVEQRMRQGRALRRKTTALVVACFVVAGLGAATYRADGFPARYATSPNDLGNRAWFSKGMPAGFSNCKELVTDVFDSWCATTGAPTIAIVGDSHAGMLWSGFAASKVRGGNRAVVLGAGNCQPAQGIETREGCVQHLDHVLDELAEMSDVRTVVLAGYHAFVEKGHVATDGELFAGYERTFTRLRREKKRIIFVVDVPELRFDAERCAPRSLLLGRLLATTPAACHETHRSDFLARPRYDALIERLRSANPDVAFFDAERVICPTTTCRLFEKDRLLYGDAHHVSIYGSKLVVDELLARYAPR